MLQYLKQILKFNATGKIETGKAFKSHFPFAKQSGLLVKQCGLRENVHCLSVNYHGSYEIANGLSAKQHGTQNNVNGQLVKHPGTRINVSSLLVKLNGLHEKVSDLFAKPLSLLTKQHGPKMEHSGRSIIPYLKLFED